MFYVIDFEDGRTHYSNFDNYYEALKYADDNTDGEDYLISEYDSEEDYYNNL